MENCFCDIHGCQQEEIMLEDGQIEYICTICEEEGRNRK